MLDARNVGKAPTPANVFGAQDGTELSRGSAIFGRQWDYIEGYVRNFAFATDSQINADPTEVICKSYKEK
jgi:hypothetical protein